MKESYQLSAPETPNRPQHEQQPGLLQKSCDTTETMEDSSINMGYL